MRETNINSYPTWFRSSTPYISAHRGKTFVVHLSGEGLESENLEYIIQDLALLHVLGVKIILVHGARPQLNSALENTRLHQSTRITSEKDMEAILSIHGVLRSRIEGMFSAGLPSSPLHKVEIAVVSGNFITAKPMGIIDGIDHLLTGETRRVNTEKIHEILDGNGLILMSPIGYSPSGQPYNLSSAELASQVAVTVASDKLIMFDPNGYISDRNGEQLTEITPAEASVLVNSTSEVSSKNIDAMIRATRGGVPRSHLVSFNQDGALLGELFTALGQGTQMTESHHKLIRKATPLDLAGIIALIRPLEESGILVYRSRNRLEQEIDQFLVADVDGFVAGCCAVYPFDDQAELACIATHPSYRHPEYKLGLGSKLLDAAEETAKRDGKKDLFVLTTQTTDWFLEHGFTLISSDALPGKKKALYNYQRNAETLIKPLITK